DYSMKEIADFFDVHYATVSRAVKRFEKELSQCKT
ncbi:MAG TPA: helix-turn-helix domain-containing protein, partial [Magnetococcales bacterium]|nr:helix-turn-helix domain-containing protein [Magnetococcales bacterium]